MANHDTFWGDESRYLMYANNLLNGHYSPRNYIDLWNGPGYPIILMPFLKLKLPLLAAKLLNPLFLFGAILYFFQTLRLYMNDRSAIFFSYLLGLYPPFCRYIHFLLSEQIAVFLICGFTYHYCLVSRNNRFSWIQMVITSLFLGYLALTKVFFGFVILSGIIIFMSLYVWQNSNVFKKIFLVYLFALLICIPYLYYTYSITGKIFYWGNAGGIGLYTMSSPYEDEFGGLRTKNLYESENHIDLFNEFDKRKLTNIQIDDELKKQAIHNIVNNPAKYFKNWMANIGRLLFNYPFSYDHQKLSTYFYFISNMFLVVFCILCLYPSYVGSSLIPTEIYGICLFFLISFGGSSLVFAESRYFSPLVPLLMVWISFTLTRLLKIEIIQEPS